mgnify:CR=1
MSENIKLKAAIIRRDWFEHAQKLLPNSVDRCAFYEMIICRSLGIEHDINISQVVQAMFTMVEPAIVNDIEKYAARCRRNAENANRQRVAASGIQSPPMASNSNPNSNTNSNTNTKSKSNSNSEEVNTSQIETDRFNIFLVFFQRGCMKIVEEYQRFDAYYTSIGWKNSKGVPIVSKTAAAMMWQFKCDTYANIEDRKLFAAVFKGSSWTNIKPLITFESMRVQGEFLELSFNGSDDFIDDLEKSLQGRLIALVRTRNCSSLTYRCLK